VDNIMNHPITIGGFTAPDSHFARKAASVAARAHGNNPAMLHHVHRSWWFAEFLGKQRGLKYDREVVYIASLLHDLGLTDEFVAHQRFETDGAHAARRILLDEQYSDAKAQLVWEGIALHSSLGVADLMAPEIALVSLGAHVDVMGLNYNEISPSLIADTLELYPRIGFKAAFQEALAQIARTKPLTTVGTGIVDIGRRYVEGYSIPDVCDLLDHAPFES
jgi:hypothetical protein